MISTPSYPPSRASAAHAANASMCSSTSCSSSARGAYRLIGALIADGATRSGCLAYRPACRICRAIAPARLVHGVGDDPVGRQLVGCGEQRTARAQGAERVRGVPTGHHQPDPAAGPLGEVGGEPRCVGGVVLQPGVHRAHEDPVGQGEEAQVQRGEQVRVAHAVTTGAASRARSSFRRILPGRRLRDRVHELHRAHLLVRRHLSRRRRPSPRPRRGRGRWPPARRTPSGSPRRRRRALPPRRRRPRRRGSRSTASSSAGATW